ncbi:7d8fc7cb-3d92-40d9-aa60-58f970f47c47-CDS [Sclerotinia trifoliorum]|uniref:7d8fc7cb-3d92-40d9-aa60-58f970f47c47-CDS n=1 Tax=Sclerotinia trifoliorum TaxID=28548 RepID=A0A8H2W4D6_9HELO|nr:7d8fc7cb-3d92-40d9-aa60-58f970f47c47-CDS [Sclerotinia trifoliorum]
MGQAFSGPNAFKWLGFTPKATAVLQADPFLFVQLILVLVGLSVLVGIAWWIHYETNKPYAKPKVKKDAKK